MKQLFKSLTRKCVGTTTESNEVEIKKIERVELEEYRPEPGDVLIVHVEVGDAPLSRVDQQLDAARKVLKTALKSHDNKIIVAPMRYGKRQCAIEIIRKDELEKV